MSEANAVVEKVAGWFDIPGVQDGQRSLDEQMLGLHPALAEADGKTVLDMGCAEGLIAIEFAKAGAVVGAIDYNAAMIDIANRCADALPSGVARPRFMAADLNEFIAEARHGPDAPSYDIVLALAILHKLGDPGLGAKYAASRARDLLVIRLPEAQDGTAIRGKHSGLTSNINKIIGQRGFRLEKTLKGPRNEAVLYWRRLLQPV